MPRHVGFFLFRHIPPFLVEDIHRDGTHMVVEHVGSLQVVVILKGEVQPCGAIVQVVLHHRTGGRHGARRRQAAPRRKPFFHLIPHISLFFVQHSFLRSFSFLYIVGFAAHAAPPHGFLFRWANPCRFYVPARLVPGPAERPVSLPAEGSRPKGALPFLFLKKGRPESPETARPPPYFTLFIHLLQDAFIGPHPESVSPKAKYGFPLQCIGSTGRHSAYLRQALRRNRCFSGPSR